MKQPYVHTLKTPVEIRNTEGETIETITTVTVKPPKGRNFRAMDSAKGQVGMTMALLGSCADLPPSTVDLIDGEDLLILLEVAGGFFPASLKTGER